MIRIILTVLTGASVISTAFGLLTGTRRLVREYRTLDEKLATVKDLAAANRGSREDHSAERNEILSPSSDLGDVLYLREVIRWHVLKQARDNLRAPLAWTLGGILLGMISSIWSLWA